MATDASLDDTVDGSFVGRLDFRAVLVRNGDGEGLDSRLTTKHDVVAVAVGLVVGGAIAWKATDASLNDTPVVGFGGVLGEALVVCLCRVTPLQVE